MHRLSHCYRVHLDVLGSTPLLASLATLSSQGLTISLVMKTQSTTPHAKRSDARFAMTRRRLADKMRSLVTRRLNMVSTNRRKPFDYFLHGIERSLHIRPLLRVRYRPQYDVTHLRHLDPGTPGWCTFLSYITSTCFFLLYHPLILVFLGGRKFQL